MSSFPLVVFDLDGTLVDTAPDLVGALNVVLASEGLTPVPMQSARQMIGAGARRLIELGLEQDGRMNEPGDIDRMVQQFLAHYTDHIADESRPFDGLNEALDDLAGRGWHFAVCTNKLEGLAKLLLEKLDLTHRFRVICGADTFGVSKPDPVILRQTVAKAGGDMARTIMVGDAGPDIGVARRAGVPVVGVTFGYTSTPIEELDPDYLISQMADLPKATRHLAGDWEPALAD